MAELITRDDLKAAIDSRSVTVVDALPASYYNQQHLPGAINLVESDVVNNAPTLLPDKGATIVTYCSIAACPNSENVAAQLERLGYTTVHRYREGIQDWVGAGLPVESTPFAAQSPV